MPAYQFNSAQYEPSYGSRMQQFSPAKMLKVMIVHSEQKPTAKGDGGYLQFILKALEGPQAGNEGFDNLNLHNINAKTVEIANKQLAAYCHVTGVYSFQQTEQLHNIPFCVDVGWQKGQEPTTENPSGGYTEIKALYDINGNPPSKAGNGPARQAAPVAPPPPNPPAGVQPVGGGWDIQQQPSPPTLPTSQPWSQNAAPASQGWGNK